MGLKSFFNEKKVLLFSPQFFGYGEAVAQKIRSYGAEVDYYDERPGNDFMTKALIRIDKSLLNRKIHRYYKKIIDALQNDHYDFVLFLNLEAISEKDLLKLKKTQSRAIFIMYMWDSVKNKKHTASLMPYFDLKHTFDKNDSRHTDFKSFNFRPLFFLDEYRDLGKNVEKELDLLFVGTVHSDRYQLLMKIRDLCQKMQKTTDFFMFFMSKKLFYARKASDKSFKMAKINDFEFVPLSKENLILKLARSKVVLDIQHPSQTGLTMRTIEMIGAKKKIITTNHSIKDYDFYHPGNILCIDRDNIELNESFFETEYVPIDDGTYHKYSIEGWLEDVFSIHIND